MPRNEVLIFDDEYTGPRWRYGMCFRPPAIGHQPHGRIIGADKPGSVGGYPMINYGTIEYPRELTQDEIASYELIDLNDPSIHYTHSVKALCGRLGVRVTMEYPDVTCEACKREMEHRAAKREARA